LSNDLAIYQMQGAQTENEMVN